MTVIGPILVATDFSAHARHAADRAARLAHEAHSALTLLHVLPGEPLAQIREWLGASSAPEQKNFALQISATGMSPSFMFQQI